MHPVHARMMFCRVPLRLPCNKLHARALSFTAMVRDDAEAAKPFSQIPGPKVPITKILMRYVLGDKKAKTNILQMHLDTANTYGKLVKLTLPLGIPPMLFVADPDALEVVYRNIGTTPYRPGFESMSDYLQQRSMQPGLIWS